MIHSAFRERPPRRNPDGHRFGLISYLDILGFSEFAWSNPQNVISEILSYSENYTRSAGNHVGNAGTPPREHLRFQDSLVRCTEIGWAYAEDYLDDLHAWKMHIAFQEEIASLRD